jgi:hypothetical protein
VRIVSPPGQTPGMGIRYYGWAINANEVDEAADDPWQVIRRADQRHNLPGWTNTDFDKA